MPFNVQKNLSYLREKLREKEEIVDHPIILLYFQSSRETFLAKGEGPGTNSSSKRKKKKGKRLKREKEGGRFLSPTTPNTLGTGNGGENKGERKGKILFKWFPEGGGGGVWRGVIISAAATGEKGKKKWSSWIFCRVLVDKNEKREGKGSGEKNLSVGGRGRSTPYLFLGLEPDRSREKRKKRKKRSRGEVSLFFSFPISGRGDEENEGRKKERKLKEPTSTACPPGREGRKRVKTSFGMTGKWEKGRCTRFVLQDGRKKEGRREKRGPIGKKDIRVGVAGLSRRRRGGEVLGYLSLPLRRGRKGAEELSARSACAGGGMVKRGEGSAQFLSHSSWQRCKRKGKKKH